MRKNYFPQISKFFLLKSDKATHFDCILESSITVKQKCNDGYVFINLFPALCFYHCHLLCSEWQLPGLTNSAVMYFHVEQHIVIISLILLDEIALSEIRWHFAWHFGVHFIAVCVGHTMFFLEQAIKAHQVLLSEIIGKCFFFQKSYVTSIWDIRGSAKKQMRHIHY